MRYCSSSLHNRHSGSIRANDPSIAMNKIYAVRKMCTGTRDFVLCREVFLYLTLHGSEITMYMHFPLLYNCKGHDQE